MSNKEPNYSKRYFIWIFVLVIIVITLMTIDYPGLFKKNIFKKLDKITILEAAAASLNKKPEEITEEDFAKVTELDFTVKFLSDLSGLEKFTNLQTLRFYLMTSPNDLKKIKGIPRIINARRRSFKRSSGLPGATKRGRSQTTSS